MGPHLKVLQREKLIRQTMERICTARQQSFVNIISFGEKTNVKEDQMGNNQKA